MSSELPAIHYAYGVQSATTLKPVYGTKGKQLDEALAKANGFEALWGEYVNEKEGWTIYVFFNMDVQFNNPKYFVSITMGEDETYIIAYTLLDLTDALAKVKHVFGDLADPKPRGIGFS